jgi:hypothetical protein
MPHSTVICPLSRPNLTFHFYSKFDQLARTPCNHKDKRAILLGVCAVKKEVDQYQCICPYNISGPEMASGFSDSLRDAARQHKPRTCALRATFSNALVS